jgi:hypothetical protein
MVKAVFHRNVEPVPQDADRGVAADSEPTEGKAGEGGEVGVLSPSVRSAQKRKGSQLSSGSLSAHFRGSPT